METGFVMHRYRATVFRTVRQSSYLFYIQCYANYLNICQRGCDYVFRKSKGCELLGSLGAAGLEGSNIFIPNVQPYAKFLRQLKGISILPLRFDVDW